MPEKGIWCAASSLESGDKLLTIKGEKIEVEKMEINEQEAQTHNLEIESFHVYFVGCNSILVHNDDRVSIFLSTAEYTSDVYVIRDRETQAIIYVGQTIQGVETRISDHLSDPKSSVFQYLKEKYTATGTADLETYISVDKPVARRQLTPYELSVWEQYYIDLYRSQGISLLNKNDAITNEKFTKYKNLHNPCR